jgi:propionate catabolism operon transcriptional regulator
VISATHCDLEERVREGRFRADLFYRLAVLRVTLPALRERIEDVPALAEWLLKNALAALGVRPHANLHAEIAACAPLLARHSWPGNVRELRNLMERVALFLAAEPLQALSPGLLLSAAPELGKAATQPAVATVLPAPETVKQVLARFDGNRAAAAKHLGISRTTLWRKLNRDV